MSDHRNAERVRTFLKGRIEYNNGQASTDCLIRDLSKTGARIAVSDSVTLPDHFRLFIPKTNRWVDARTRWRRPESIGVAFEADPADAQPVADAARMRELEAEVVRLRRLLEELRADPTRIHLLLDHAV